MRFLGTRSDVSDLLAALDVFVLTSKMEANPVSILEAMAAGKPVVAPRVGSVAESVADGQTGFLTEPFNEIQTAERIAKLFADPQLAHRLGTAARSAVEAHWSLDSMVEGYQDLIATIYRAKSCRANRGAPSTSGEERQPAASA